MFIPGLLSALNYFWAGAEGAAAGGESCIGACWLCAGGVTLSMMELFLDEEMARKNDVIMKMMAAPVVSFAMKLWAPRGPNTVFEAPPKAAPISAPLPFCRRTIPIKMVDTII
jgi:hypothetical protein